MNPSMLQSQRHLFSLEEDIHYLNCAYMSPLMKSVEEAGIDGLVSKRNPHKITPQDFFEDSTKLREEFARLIKADDPSRIALISSTSYGLAAVAKNIDIKEGDEVLILEDQFPSNYYIWERKTSENDAKIVVVSGPGGTKSWSDRVLDQINEKTKVVALPHVHWADGSKFDLVEIRKRSREVGALLIIDGTQSVGALPFYIDEIQPDALICSGYKWLLGPYSIGVAYLGPYFDSGLPLEENWIDRKNSEDFSGLVNYQSEYQPGLVRFDVGERSNFILVPMLLESIRQINEWGVENIYEYCKNYASSTIDELVSAGYNIPDEHNRAHHLFGVRKENFDPQLFRDKLSERNIYVSVRGDAVRVSVNVYNTPEDIEAFKSVCLELAD